MADSKAYCSGNRLLTTGTSGSASFSFHRRRFPGQDIVTKNTFHFWSWSSGKFSATQKEQRAISPGLLSFVIPDAMDLELDLDAIITADDFLETGTVVAVPDFAVDIHD